MDRRNLLKGIGAVTLYGSFPAVLSQFAASCKTADKQLHAGFFSDEEFHLVEEISDVLLPETSSPGALQAQVPYFIDLVLKNCMSADDQQLIKQGLQQMNERPGFSSISSKEKIESIRRIDEDAFKENSDHVWFRIVKKLALIGYFTSQQGMSKALNYVKVPGDYKACIPYKNGEKALAKTFLLYW